MLGISNKKILKFGRFLPLKLFYALCNDSEGPRSFWKQVQIQRCHLWGKKYFTQGLFFLYDVLPAITQQQNKEHFSFGRFFALGTI